MTFKINFHGLESMILKFLNISKNSMIMGTLLENKTNPLLILQCLTWVWAHQDIYMEKSKTYLKNDNILMYN